LLLVQIFVAALVQVFVAAQEEWPQQHCTRLAERVEQQAARAFQLPARPKSLLTDWLRPEWLAMPVLTWASLQAPVLALPRWPQVQPVLAEATWASRLELQASELVWVPQQRVLAPGRMESQTPVWAPR
jgi:hypothetical protein